MKKMVLIIGMFVLMLICVGPGARAQGGAARGPDASTVRDADLEKDSMHNLEVARQYFKLKKAYVASLRRTEEIIAGNPTFSKLDEALYMAGMSSLYLSQNKGKQSIAQIPEKDRLTPERYREEARRYLSLLVNDYPDSSFRKQAQNALKDLGGPMQKDSMQ